MPFPFWSNPDRFVLNPHRDPLSFSGMLSVKRICNTEEGCTFSHIVLFLLREPRECLVLDEGGSLR